MQILCAQTFYSEGPKCVLIKTWSNNVPCSDVSIKKRSLWHEKNERSFVERVRPNLNQTLSVTRWVDCLFNIWPFATMNICPRADNISHSRLKNCQKFYKHILVPNCSPIHFILLGWSRLKPCLCQGISYCSWKIACWRPAPCWLGLGSTSISDPSKSHKSESGN